MATIIPKYIRPIAIGIFYKGKSIFVFEGHDSKIGQTFYRPLGGAIEFGEHGAEALKREINEEIKANIEIVKFIGVVENLFTYEGQPGHEIVMVYHAEFLSDEIYNQEIILGKEDNGEEFKAIWKPIIDFVEERAILYPEGILRVI
jgi:ADP-ribose pyrophosphatase YjhB (NUDIX family)